MYLTSLNSKQTSSTSSVAFNVTHMLTSEEMSLCNFEPFLKVTLYGAILHVEVLDDAHPITQEVIGKMSGEFVDAKSRLATQKNNLIAAHKQLMGVLEDATGLRSD